MCIPRRWLPSHISQPTRSFDVTLVKLAFVIVDRPSKRLRQSPAASAFPVKSQFARQPVESMSDMVLAAPKFVPTYDCRDAELAFARKWLRVNEKPGLPLRPQDVARAQVLAQQHEFALCLGEALQHF